MLGRSRARGGIPRPRHGALLVILAIAVLIAAPAARADLAAGGAGFYRFTMEIAPLDLDGTFPVSVDTGSGAVEGALTMAVDGKGKIAGTLVFAGETLTAGGKVKQGAKASRMKLTAKGPVGKLTLKGKLDGATFTGTSKGKGGVASGKGSFTLDVSSAKPLTAAVEFVLTKKGKKKLTGAGTVTIHGQEMPLKGSGRGGALVKIKLKGGGMKWSAAGSGFAAGLFLDWKSTGFGAKHSGDGLEILILEPPVNLRYPSSRVEFEARVTPLPFSPSVDGGDVDGIEIAPGLPAGLTLHSGSGVISGTPADPTPEVEYTVTARNGAGVATAKLRISVRINREDSLARQPDDLSDEDIRHLLSRTSFGTTGKSFQDVTKKGLVKSVDGMLVFRKGTKLEQEADKLLVNEDDPKGFKGGFPSASQLTRWWLFLMLRNENPFQEVLAFFWHDHFAASSEVLSSERRYWMKKHINLWRHEGNGNLRDLLLDMARDWAMLRWLDGISSTARAPNENFAREFWELFTLGVDNGYSQEDILEAARAFTGYRERLNEATGQRYIEFDPDRHDAGDKEFFGRTIPGQNGRDDYAAVVDITLEERPAAEFITKKLFEYFCYRDPSDAIVDELAAVLRSNGWELKPLLKKILTSEAFFSDRAKADRPKSPVDFTVGFIRTTGLEIQLSTLQYHLRDQGQEPTRPPVVDGWPSDEMWLAAQQMVERANLVRTCIYDRRRQGEEGIDVADILPPAAQRSSEEVVDHLAGLLRVPLTSADRSDLVEYLDSKRNSNGTVVVDPFDGTDEGHIDERVRGLLYILAQHPGYHAR